MEQQTENKTYIAIDLKSFYASVECVDRGLDPLKARLVVADQTRTDKTICLAVSPALKAYGIPGRARLFEVVQKVKEINAENPGLNLDYIVAPPRMSRYMEVSTKVYEIYLKYVAPEDMHIYSVDEVFMDVTHYLKTYGLSAWDLTVKIIHDVLSTTGITATAGIGTNMYLCKIAMDVEAKHVPADKDGVRIAELNEQTYRQRLWGHTPITDFWRVGKGIAKKLNERGIYTMGDVARCSLGKPNEYYNEDLLYKLFGVNAELLIDHAWGYEPCTIAEIKAYRPKNRSLGQGQVLKEPVDFENGKLIIKEMADWLALSLSAEGIVTDQIVITVNYDNSSLDSQYNYQGDVALDHYGRAVAKPAHGTIHLGLATDSAATIMAKAAELYDRVVNPALPVRRLNIAACNVLSRKRSDAQQQCEQLNLFTNYGPAAEAKRAKEQKAAEDQHNLQQAMLKIKSRYGKNAILKGMDYQEGGTTRERNGQIGGHKA